MHYFKRNIGDYHKKAGRLSMLEHGAYTLLIDACYDREIFPTIEQALDWCWAKDDAEIAAVKFVLTKFFTVEDGLYVQDRIREEIANYHNNSKVNKDIAIERERKRKEAKARSEHESCTDEHEAPPNHKPLTINQEPLLDIQADAYIDKSILLDDITALFNQICTDLPKCQNLSDARKKRLRAQFKKSVIVKGKKYSCNELDFWENYFYLIHSIDWLNGRTDKKFNIDFDYIIRESNIIKFCEAAT